jgi:hypothetical protein
LAWVAAVLAWPWIVAWLSMPAGLSAILLGLLTGVYWAVLAAKVPRVWCAALAGGSLGVTADGFLAAPADQITNVAGALNKVAVALVPMVVAIGQASGLVNPTPEIVGYGVMTALAGFFFVLVATLL